jgi:hypothetical protein
MIVLAEHISSHFTWYEAINSETAKRQGIDNEPSESEEDNIIYTGRQMENIRAVLGAPIHVSSWYRNFETNKLVGGSKQSDHLLGLAVDFIVLGQDPFYTCTRIQNYFTTLGVQDLHVYGFNQLIYEFSWVHISWKRRTPGSVAKMEVLTYDAANQHYLPGIVRLT